MKPNTSVLLFFLSLATAWSSPAFDGLVAHQEDRSECQSERISGCTPRVAVTSVIAIDKDGATVTRLMPSELEAEHWTIQGRGVTATAFPRIGKYFAIPTENQSPVRTWAAMLDGARDCNITLDGTPQAFTVLGHEQVSGYRTVKMKHQRASSIIWRAPDLGCFILQTEDRFPGLKGGPAQIMRKRTTAITLGPPPAEYFSFPAQWKHESPVAVWTAQIQQRFKGDAAARMLADLRSNPGLRKQQEMWEAKPEKLDLHRPR